MLPSQPSNNQSPPPILVPVLKLVKQTQPLVNSTSNALIQPQLILTSSQAPLNLPAQQSPTLLNNPEPLLPPDFNQWSPSVENDQHEISINFPRNESSASNVTLSSLETFDAPPSPSNMSQKQLEKMYRSVTKQLQELKESNKAPTEVAITNPQVIVEKQYDEWIGCKKNSIVRSYNGYLYRKDRKYFRCKEKECKAQLICHADGTCTVKGNHVDHFSNYLVVCRDKALGNMRARCLEDNKVPVKFIFQDEKAKCREISEDAAATIVWEKYKSALYRIRARLWPTLPKNLDEFLELLKTESSDERISKILKTKDGREFFHSYETLADGETYVLFGTTEDFRRLANAKRWFMDGTFSIQPKMFQQLFSIHAIHNNDKSMPCCYAFMTSKSQPLYEAFLRRVADTCQRINKDWSLEKVTSDFETGLLPAISSTLGCQVTGCLFHFTQCLNRWFVKNGFHKEKTVKEALNIARKFASLAFLPCNQIRIYAKKRLDELPPVFLKFKSYFEEQWLKKIPPELWCIHKLDVRTNNNVECKLI